MRDDGFYRAFEDRHRGGRELIKKRLAVYLPFIAPLKALYSQLDAVDLGCGRGEWMELLAAEGFRPHGVDLDEGMLEACEAHGLSTAKEDALECLRGLADESQVIISGFHIAEHIPFESLQQLVSEALRVLKPCGLLILETPNPENILVGTVNFYQDPTHLRPLPADLLSFLPQYYGFKRSKVLRLQEPQQLVHAENIALMNVFAGASPDYAVIAQKDGADDHLKTFNTIFKTEIGLKLETLAERYDTYRERRFADMEKHINDPWRARLDANITIIRAERAESRLALLEEQRRQMEEQHRQAQAQLTAIYSSTSWFITKPLRAFSQFLHWVRQLPRRIARGQRIVPKTPFKSFRLKVATYISGHPGIRGRIESRLARFPRLRDRFTRFVRERAAVAAPPASPMTENSKRIYREIKTAIAPLDKEES